MIRVFRSLASLAWMTWVWALVIVALTGCKEKQAAQADLRAPDDLASAVDLTPSSDLSTPDLFPGADLGVVAPVVTYAAPAGGNVPLTPTIQIQFSQPMDTAMTTVSLAPSVTFGAPSWTNGDTQVAYAISSTLAYDTSYTLTVVGRNKANVALSGSTMTTFTTVPVPDTTAPTITSFTPTDTSTNVSVQPTLTIEFSEAIAASTLTVVTTPGAPMRWTVAADGKTATGALATCVGLSVCVPVTNFLLPFTGYTFKVAAKDAAGNGLTGKTSYVLTTGQSPLTDIKSTLPSFEEEGFPVANNIKIEFTKAVDVATLNSTSIDFYEEASIATKVAFAVSLSGDKKTVTINPSANLKTSTWYNIDIKPNAIALDGMPSTYLVPTTTGTFPATTPAIYKMAFSTAADTTKPTVLSAGMWRVGSAGIATLNDGGAAISLADPGQGMRFSFSEPMGTGTTSAFSLKAGASSVPITVAWDAQQRNAYVSLVDPYSYGTAYTLELDKTAAVDRAGNAIAATGKHVYAFTTPYVKELTIDPDSGLALGPRTVYSVKPPIDEDPQLGLWVGERNYWATGEDKAAQALCVLGTVVTGTPTIGCKALPSNKSLWLKKSKAATLVSFTLPAEITGAPSVIAARLTTSGAKLYGNPFGAGLGPVRVESLYLTSFTDDNAITLGALADATSHLVIAGTSFESQLRDKVAADIGRSAAQSNKSQLRIVATGDDDKDLEDDDDLLLIQDPKLFVSYLSATP